jgi:hypothetical protein
MQGEGLGGGRPINERSFGHRFGHSITETRFVSARNGKRYLIDRLALLKLIRKKG